MGRGKRFLFHLSGPIFFFFLYPLVGQLLAQEQTPVISYEQPARVENRTAIDGEADRFGPLEDPPPSTLSSQPPQVSLSIVLPRPSEAEEAALVQDEPDRVGPLQIGFGRAVPADYRGGWSGFRATKRTWRMDR